MENETLFFDRMKNIFKDEFDQFKVNLNEVHQPAFFLNELKADKNDILDMIDFEYCVSDYCCIGFKSSAMISSASVAA